MKTKLKYSCDWIQFLKKVPDGSVFLFLGQDYFIHQILLERALKSCNLSLPDFNFHKFEKSSIKEFIELIHEFPVMDSKKVIYVRDLDGFDMSSQEKLIGPLEGIGDFCIVFFSYYQNNTRGLSLKLANFFENKSVKVNCILNENNFTFYARDFFKKNDVNFEPEALRRLWQNSGGDFGFIQKEMEKLVSYKFKEKNITRQDVEKISTKNINVKVYEIMKFIASRNPRLALDILSDLQGMGEEPLKIMGYLISQFIFLSKIRGFLEKNRADDIYAVFSRENPYRLKKALEEVRFFPLDRLSKSLRVLKIADMKVKREQVPRLILELVVVQLCKA